MPPNANVPHCVLEVWDTATKAWMTDRARHETIAEATAAATERGIYRVAVVNGDRCLYIQPFAII